MHPTIRHRQRFPTLDKGIYLLSHSLGPVPGNAAESLGAYVDAWRDHPDHDAWEAHWWDLSRQVGDHVARIIGAGPGTVQVQPNASVALSVIASCFDFTRGPRRKVVTTALDFPSMGYIWEAQRRVGAEIHVVPSDDGIVTSTERIVDAIDEQTALVALAHVSYRSSFRVDTKAIIDRARQCGALVLLDVYHSAGVVEIDAAGWGVDFLIGGSIKWLCGGPACGYLYVRPELVERLQPRLTGWFAHADPQGNRTLAGLGGGQRQSTGLGGAGFSEALGEGSGRYKGSGILR